MDKSANPWFGPKLYGWGWRPITWQGWLISLILVVFLISSTHFNLPKTHKLIADVAALVVFCALAYVTGGKPGSKLSDKN
jgi:hypothetical protein